MIASENLVTFEELEGYRVVRQFGYVSGVASQQRNRLRSTFRSLGMLIGMSQNEFLSDAEHLRTQALEAMRTRADALGANAVIALNFYVSEGSDGSCKVVAFGQAVLAVKDETGT